MHFRPQIDLKFSRIQKYMKQAPLEPELAEILASRDLDEILVLAQINSKMREANNKGLADLMSVYTAQEIVCALRVMKLMREYECSYKEVGVALRLRKCYNAQYARYHETHREESNKKNAERMRMKRAQKKVQKLKAHKGEKTT